MSVNKSTWIWINLLASDNQARHSADCPRESLASRLILIPSKVAFKMFPLSNIKRNHFVRCSRLSQLKARKARWTIRCSCLEEVRFLNRAANLQWTIRSIIVLKVVAPLPLVHFLGLLLIVNARPDLRWTQVDPQVQREIRIRVKRRQYSSQIWIFQQDYRKIQHHAKI